jgi:hypothetical protein
VFREVGLEAGLTDVLPTDNAIWLDYNKDGFLDLYTGNLACGSEPPDLTAINKLYRNNGDGTFRDATVEAGLNVQMGFVEQGACVAGSNGGMAAGDVNDDGWPDLYIGVWSSPNRLFLNDGQGHFRDATTEQVADPGQAFGIAVGDVNNDGHLDIFQAAGAFGIWKSIMLLNLGEGQFLDVTVAAGLTGVLAANVLSAGLADIDDDGDLDLVVGIPHLLYLNTGRNPPEFVDQTAQAGDIRPGYPVLFGDYDLDGFLDMVIDCGPQCVGYVLYRNNGNTNHRLRVELVGTKSNRNGIGARLIAASGDLRQMREILGGRGFEQDELVAHFGLGQRTQVERLEIRWPSGQVEVLTDLPADQKIRVIEGQGRYHVVTPTVWEGLDSLVVGWTLPFQAIVRPALFEEGAKVTQVVADLREVGGPSEVPLVAAGDGTYRLNAPLTVKGASGLKAILIMIDQATSVGPYWTQLTKTLTILPVTDLVIFGDAVAEGWTMEPGTGVTETPQTTVVAEGTTALALQATGRWRVDMRPAVPMETVGYTALRFAVHLGDVPVARTNSLSVAMNNKFVGIVRRNPGDIGVDFAEKAWQVVEIPLEKFSLAGPIETIRLTGNFKGTFYLDDLRLVAVPSPPMPPPPTAVEEERSGARPQRFALEQNVPNPFNGETVIRFALPEGRAGQDRTVTLTIYNLAGQRVTTVVNGVYPAGVHTVRWDGRDRAGRALPSGVYVARLQAGERVATRKLVVIR